MQRRDRVLARGISQCTAQSEQDGDDDANAANENVLLKSFVGADEKGSPCWAPHVASDTRRWHTSLVWRLECLELPQEQTFPSAALMSQNDPKRKSISGHSVRPTFGTP
jgi:hypothetical protein